MCSTSPLRKDGHLSPQWNTVIFTYQTDIYNVPSILVLAREKKSTCILLFCENVKLSSISEGWLNEGRAAGARGTVSRLPLPRGQVEGLQEEKRQMENASGLEDAALPWGLSYFSNNKMKTSLFGKLEPEESRFIKLTRSLAWGGSGWLPCLQSTKGFMATYNHWLVCSGSHWREQGEFKNNDSIFIHSTNILENLIFKHPWG